MRLEAEAVNSTKVHAEFIAHSCSNPMVFVLVGGGLLGRLPMDNLILSYMTLELAFMHTPLYTCLFFVMVLFVL